MKQIIAMKSIDFKSNVSDIFEIMTDNTKYKWRTNVDKVSIMNENIFTEYAKNGAETKFYVTEFKTDVVYKMNIESNMFTGKFIADFESLENGGARVKFTEEIYPRNIFAYFFAKISKVLETLQNQYIKDLKEALKEEPIKLEI